MNSDNIRTQSIEDEIKDIDTMLIYVYNNHFERPSTADKRAEFIRMITGIKKVIKYGNYNYLTTWFVNFIIFAVESKQPLAGIISERILFYISHILLTKITISVITHFELYWHNGDQFYDYNTSILSLMLVYMNEYKLNDVQKFNGFYALKEIATSGIDKLCSLVNTSPMGPSKLVGLYSPMMLILIMDPTILFKDSIYTVKSIDLDLFKEQYCAYTHFEIAYSVLRLDIKRLRIIREQNYPRCCATCNSRESKLLLCKKCKSEYYCSKECQKSDWHSHRNICVSKKDLYNNLVEFVQGLVY
jgi:hypothetical protein